MEPFDFYKGRIVEWYVDALGRPMPLRYWEDIEGFGEYLDDGIEFYNKHSKKTPITLPVLKAFYDDEIGML